MARLGDYISLKTGKLDVNASSEDGQYPFFTCATKIYRIDNWAYDCECVLIAGNGDLNVKYYEGKFNAYQRTYILESKDKEKLDVRYLFHFMNKYIETLREGSIGGVIKYIKKGDIEEADIPLERIEEQRKTVAILDKAYEIKQNSDELNSIKYDIIQSYFVEIFGNPSARDRWPLHSIEEIAYDVQYGTAKKANEDGFGIPVLRMNNLTEEGFINLDSLKYCELEDKELDKYTVSKLDILFNRTNSPKLVGKTSLWLLDENYSFAGYLIRVRLNSDIIDPYYLWSYMNSAYCKAFLFQKAKASNNMSNFSGGELKKMIVPIPPKPLQMKFRKLVETTMRAWDFIDSIEESSSTLVDSLSQEILV